MYLLYSILIYFVLIAGFPYLLFRWAKNGYTKIGGLRERFGFLPRDIREAYKGKRFWIHAASVGEVKVAGGLIKGIRDRWEDAVIVLSTFTETGRLVARMEIKEIDSLILFPFDIPWVVRRYIDVIAPDIFVMIEAEIWPNTLRLMKTNNIPVIMVNGRVSERSYNNYRHRVIRRFLKEVLNCISLFSMRTEKDYQRIVDLGADPSRVLINGNLKYDKVLLAAAPVNSGQISKILSIPVGSPVVIFGCTRPGEERLLSNPLKRLINKYPEVIFILAPRHLNRIKEVESILREEGLDYIKRSDLHNRDIAFKKRQILLVDTIGELFQMYSICSMAFVGGSMAPFGGHNILEPAAFSKPVIFGRDMSNFEEEAELLISTGGGIQISDADELYSIIDDLLSDPERRDFTGKAAFQAVKENFGSTGKTLRLIEDLL
ncbi:MAG: 3-deoxy-D-manno-octulosonic acid transferase [Nitrospinota bacterium]